MSFNAGDTVSVFGALMGCSFDITGKVVTYEQMVKGIKRYNKVNFPAQEIPEQCDSKIPVRFSGSSVWYSYELKENVKPYVKRNLR